MEIRYFPEGDVLAVTINDNHPSYGEWNDFGSTLGSTDYSSDGMPCRISFISASKGIDIEAVPAVVRERVAKYLAEHPLKAIPIEEWVHIAKSS